MPILHAGLETDMRLAAQLDQSLLISLTDMASIRNVPGAIDFHGTVNGTLSDTGRLRFVGLGGADHFEGVGENEDIPETDVTDTSVDVPVTRQGLLRNVGDLVIATGAAEDLDPERLAADMVASYDGRFNVLYAIALATAASTVGSTGVNMSNDDFHDAIYALEIANVPGPYYSALHPRQFADWQESLRSEGGSAQYSPATFDMLAIRGQGFAGSYLGVDILKMSDIQSSGADRQGAMYGAGALGYKVAIVDQRSMLGAGSAVAVRQDEVLVEITRDSSRSSVEVVGAAWVGVVVKEQARLVGIQTDA